MKNRAINFTEGKIFPILIAYAVPLALSSLIQLCFNIADFSILGNFDKSADSSAVGAVGATGAIVNLLVNAVVGLSAGANVLLARAVGAKEEGRVRDIIGTTLILSVAAGVIMTVVGMLSVRWFLDITACPANCFEGALTYMHIYFLAVPAIYVYNFGSAIIRVSGDSRSPSIYILASGGLNVILNFLLCVTMSNKVAAVAIATLVSNTLGAALTVIHLSKMKTGVCRVDLRKLSFSWRELGNIFLLGVPTAFTTAIYSISDMQMQSIINSFGSSITAGNSASAKLDAIVNSFTYPIAATAMVFVGQNVGAQKPDRVKRSIKLCVISSLAVALVMGYGALAFARPLVKILLPNDSLGMEIGVVRIYCVLSMYFICAVDSVLSFSVRAFGYPILPMLNSLFSTILLKAVWVMWIYPHLPVTGDAVKDIMNVYYCYMLSWVLSFVIQVIMFSVVYRRYLAGKIKEI